MLHNHLYNLMHQLTIESKSLWRINHYYKEDAGDCDECKEFWEKLEKDKEQHIEDLQNLIKDHFS